MRQLDVLESPGFKISMRLSALSFYCGDLKNLYDSKRFDNGSQSRYHRHATRKDWQGTSRRDYKPWRIHKANKTVS